MRFFFPCVLAGALGLVGCSGASGGDAGLDASIDANAAVDTATRDAAPCELACPGTRTCCLGADGTPSCVELADDIHNCGACNLDCVTARRGDTCANHQCGCGDFEIGCTGAENSICCPGVGGNRPYCANPGLDFSDCGGCGHGCLDVEANHCSGGMCFCGDTGGHCAGTAVDMCCSDVAGAFECVDTTTSQDHCGGCGHRCTAFEHCEGGTCVPTLDAAAFADAGTDGG
jgi:hypothetical protein